MRDDLKFSEALEMNILERIEKLRYLMFPPVYKFLEIINEK